jgi:periplasmic protein TonB
MNKALILTITILLSVNYLSVSQTKRIKQKDKNLRNSWEVYHVLKPNSEIKQGEYNKYIDKRLSIEGSYKDGNRIGIWKIYNFNNQVETEIDYDNGVIRYTEIDSVTKKERMVQNSLNPTGDRPPISLNSSFFTMYYLWENIKYPQYARENGISGKVMVAVKLNDQGSITGYSIERSVDKSLDEEALRVIRLIPFEFLPAIKNGQPIEAIIKLPVKFTLQ